MRIGARVEISDLACLAITASLSGLFGCGPTPPSHEEVRRDAAQTTAAVEQGAQEAVADARQAAAVAASHVDDVAAGVKDGLKANDTSKLNLNTASQVRLAMLPGISMEKAGKIVDGRPYGSAHQLLSRGVLNAEEYHKIAALVTVQ